MEPDKIRNTITEMIRFKISIGISEMRWPGYGKIDIDDHVPKKKTHNIEMESFVMKFSMQMV